MSASPVDSTTVATFFSLDGPDMRQINDSATKTLVSADRQWRAKNNIGPLQKAGRPSAHVAMTRVGASDAPSGARPHGDVAHCLPRRGSDVTPALASSSDVGCPAISAPTPLQSAAAAAARAACDSERGLGRAC